MTGSVEQGISVTHGNEHTLHFTVRLPVPVARVWPALAGAEGLAGWFTEAEVLEPRLDGAVTLRGLGSGRVTAWDVERVAEYTVGGGGRIRFHLERDGEAGTCLRFRHEFREESGTGTEPSWREKFERLVEMMDTP